MEGQNFQRLKELVENMARCYGPFDEAPPNAEELQAVRRLTGRDWDAEEVRLSCYEYWSHNSLEETLYFLFHGEYPPVQNMEMVFFRPKPGAVLEPRAVYEKYRLGGKMKALDKLPMEEITGAFRALPGWRECPDLTESGRAFRFDCLKQPAYWSDSHFRLSWYGRETETGREHQLLLLSCHNLSPARLQPLLDCMARFDCPLQYQEENHCY